jgi:DnaK suppressor protein
MGAKTATTKTVTAKAATKASPAIKRAVPAAKKAAPAAKKAAPVATKTAPAARNNVPAKAVPSTPVKTAPAASAAKGPVKVLTEAEILRAPEKDYMNASQLQFFRERLRSMEQEILRNAGETTEHLRESIIVPDPADRATIEEEHALELRTRDRERKLLKKIQQSIQRIDSGEYGYCEETGDPIGVPRLLARPTATLSLEAQERREMKQKMFGE